MKKIITFGVFDLLHIGHINLFAKAKQHGDYLIVAVQDDYNTVKNKPGVELSQSLEERMKAVREQPNVDEVIPYSQVDETIKEVDFDVFGLGGDQKNPHFVEAVKWCESHNKEVVLLSRTEGISSTIIRNSKK